MIAPLMVRVAVVVLLILALAVSDNQARREVGYFWLPPCYIIKGL
ncbi:Uncharacterised protein [Klebsiella michiganensis]|nr:Uncharacterised protein [Klebsiella michiganensis]